MIQVIEIAFFECLQPVRSCVVSLKRLILMSRGGESERSGYVLCMIGRERSCVLTHGCGRSWPSCLRT